jgi:hypothetical protein
MDLVTVPLISGAVAAAEAMYLYPGSQMLLPAVGQVSSTVGFGVLTAVASGVNQLVGKEFLPQILPVSWADVATRFGGPVVTGAADVALVKFSGNDQVSMGSAFLIGASSNLIGQYVADMKM